MDHFNSFETLFQSGSLNIQAIDDYANLIHNPNYVRVAANLAPLVNEFGHLSTPHKLYRLEFPEGVAGHLMKHGDGFLTAIQNDQGRILRHATIHPVEGVGIGALTGGVISAAMSSYYLAAMDRKLSNIQDKLDDVLEFLYSDKMCELYAEAKTIYSIFKNYNSFVNSDIRQIAALTAVLKAKTVSEKDLQFYYRDMNRIVKKEKKSGDQTIVNDLTAYTFACQLYGLCSVLEVNVGKNYDKDYLSFVEDDLKAHDQTHNVVLAKLDGVIDGIDIKAKPFLPFLGKQTHVNPGIDKMLGDNSPFKEYQEAVVDIRKTYNTKAEFMLDSGGNLFKKVA